MNDSGPFFGIPPIIVTAIVVGIIILIFRIFVKKSGDKIINDLSATGVKIKFASLSLLVDGLLHKRGLLILLQDRFLFIPFMGQKKIEMLFSEVSRLYTFKAGALQITTIQKDQIKFVFELINKKHNFLIFKGDAPNWNKILNETPEMKDKTAIDT